MGFGGSVEPPAPFAQNEAERLYRELAGNDDIDGVVAFSWEIAPAMNVDARQTEPAILLTGVDAAHTAGFEQDLQTVDGQPLDLATLPEGQIYVNNEMAEEMAIEPGHTLQLFILGKPVNFEVAAITKDKFLTGTGPPGFRRGAVLPLDRLQELYGTEGKVDFVAVSNRGGERGGVPLTDAVVADVQEKLEGTKLTIRPYKQDLIEQAEEFGYMMMTFFIILGLFSIAAGLLLIFMIFVMLAAERKTEMGISRAVGMKRGHLVQTFLSEGMAYNVLSAAVGAGLGVAVSLGMTRIMAILFGMFDISIVFHVTARSLIVSYSLGVVLTFVTVSFSSWRVSVLNIVRAIRDLPDPKFARAGWRSLVLGLAGLGFGVLLTWTGLQVDHAFPFSLGVSLFGICLALTLRYFGAPERPLFTGIGLAILTYWVVAAGDTLDPLLGEMDGGMEMFFLSGLMMVASATYVLVYNNDIMLWALAKTGALFTRILPAVKTAVAYPAQNRFRSGMTIAMIGLVIFALTVMSTMNSNYDRLFLSEESRGGWDVWAVDSPSNPIDDITAVLREADGFDTAVIEASGKLGVAHSDVPGVQQLREDGTPYTEDFASYPVYMAEPAWLRNTGVPLNARARGYSTDEEVWNALASDGDKVVIDAFALPSGGMMIGPSMFRLRDLTAQDTEFDPITLRLRNRTSGREREVELIGVITTGASEAYMGLYVPWQTFADVLGSPQYNVHYMRLQPGADSVEAARAIESALLERGVQSKSIKQVAEEDSQLSRAFFYLLQGFMGIGLFVGIAAVGVIAFRTVVERRQQIGMLRAIGYSRGMVGLSFLLESSFITLQGILAGIGLALLLSNRLLQSNEFGDAGFDSFYVPWLEIIAIGAFAFISSLIMTIIPARQASSIPIAEALRYE